MPGLFGWMKSRPEITATELQQRLDQGEKIYLLDVRETHEFTQGHMPGSRLTPLHQLSYNIEKLPRDRPIVAVCRSGNRSGVATDMLQRAGFTNVQNLRGGMIAWTRSGGAVKGGK